jgi:hypothetical protein
MDEFSIDSDFVVFLDISASIFICSIDYFRT